MRFVSITKAARTLGVSRETVRAWVHSGRVRFRKVGPPMTHDGRDYRRVQLSEDEVKRLSFRREAV